MPKYRVTLRVQSEVVVDAENPYMAAVIASGRHANAEVADVRRAVASA
jgi:hypothetical protein